MKKSFIFSVLILLITSCDPMSMSKVFVANKSGYNLLLKFKVFERGSKEVNVPRNSIIEVTDIVVLGTRSPDPHKHMFSLKIYNSDTMVLIKKISGKNIYKEFEVKRGSWGTEIKRYLMIITDKDLQ